MRSLGSGDPIPIAERRRLAAAHPPHIVLDCVDGSPAIFQNNAWSRSLPNIAVFDDLFVDDNVCSGLDVEADVIDGQHLAAAQIAEGFREIFDVNHGVGMC